MTEQVSEVGTQAISAPESAEKLVPQSKVNELVGQHKVAAYAKGKEDAIAELKAQQSPHQITPPSAAMGNMTPPSVANNPVDINRLVDERLAQRDQAQTGQTILNQFAAKMGEGQKLYPDFEEKMKDMKWDKIPDIIHLANTVDNTAGVMLDLRNNPSKIAQLRSLWQIDPSLAQQEVTKLSQSIKLNESAAKQSNPAEPLSQLKASAGTGTDNGERTVSDFRQKYRV